MVKLINARKHRKDQQAKETDRLEPKGTQTGLGPVQWPDANIVLPVYRADLNHSLAMVVEHGNAVCSPGSRRADLTARRVKSRSIERTEEANAGA